VSVILARLSEVSHFLFIFSLRVRPLRKDCLYQIDIQQRSVNYLMANTSKSHYVGPNPRGAADRDTASAVMVLAGIFVFLRLWGRFKYTSPGDRSWPQFGEPRFWILLSDLTLLLSFVSMVWVEEGL